MRNYNESNIEQYSNGVSVRSIELYYLREKSERSGRFTSSSQFCFSDMAEYSNSTDAPFYFDKRTNEFVCKTCDVRIRASVANGNPELVHRTLDIACYRLPAEDRPYFHSSSPLYRSARRLRGFTLPPHVALHKMASDDIIDYHLTNPVVRSLIDDVGFEGQLIRQAIKRQLETTGKYFNNVAELVDTIL